METNYSWQFIHALVCEIMGRLRKNITLDKRQKGFVPVDGCFENVKIIQQIVKQQRKNRKEYNLVFIDLAKAFDTVSHLSIEKGLKRKGIPEQVRETILAMYKDASTKLTVGGKTTRRPLLFNLIIDELIEKLKENNIGIQLGESKVCCMAFADDLVLITEERIHMQILIEQSKEFFDKKGLQANAGKCASLRVLPAGKKRTLKIITSVHRTWGRENIPPITFKNLVKNLGVELRPDGEVKLPRKTCDSYLTNILAAHLNPNQKVDAICQVIIAKIQYQLRLSDHGLEKARKINRLIRKYVKKILHLPTWVSNNWIHHRNGSNIPDLVTATVITRNKATAKMKTSKDATSRHTGDQIHPLNEERLLRLGLLNEDNKKRTHLQNIGKPTEKDKQREVIGHRNTIAT